MIIYNKLVRDNIPDIIEKSGKKAVIKILNEKEFYKALTNKLQEELNEFLSSDNLEELVDIGEVIHAILEFKSISLEEYQKARNTKKTNKGGFEKHLFLIGVEDNE